MTNRSSLDKVWFRMVALLALLLVLLIAQPRMHARVVCVCVCVCVCVLAVVCGFYWLKKNTLHLHLVLFPPMGSRGQSVITCWVRWLHYLLINVIIELVSKVWVCVCVFVCSGGQGWRRFRTVSLGSIYGHHTLFNTRQCRSRKHTRTPPVHCWEEMIKTKKSPWTAQVGEMWQEMICNDD